MPEQTIAERLGEENVKTWEPEELNPVPQENPGIDLSFFKAPTGEGDISLYMEHPLNFNNSKGTARIIRGLTGMFGSLDLAIVDVFIGVLDLLKTNKKAVTRNESNPTGGIMARY